MSAQYRIRRDALWSEIVAAVRRKYPRMQIAELDAARLVTAWTETSHRVLTDIIVDRGSEHVRAQSIPALVRAIVVVTGTNPYQIDVEMEAAIYLVPGKPPTVYRHDHVGDEVPWLPGTQEALRLAIHDRLRAYEHAQ